MLHYSSTLKQSFKTHFTNNNQCPCNTKGFTIKNKSWENHIGMTIRDVNCEENTEYAMWRKIKYFRFNTVYEKKDVQSKKCLVKIQRLKNIIAQTIKAKYLHFCIQYNYSIKS